MTFDPAWPHGHTTRDGRKVTIYCTDAPGDYPIHGRIEHRGDPVSWRFDGEYDGGSSPLDLINAPAPVERIDQTVFVNVWRANKTYHTTQRQAEDAIGDIGVIPDRTAVRCRLVEIVEAAP